MLRVSGRLGWGLVRIWRFRLGAEVYLNQYLTHILGCAYKVCARSRFIALDLLLSGSGCKALVDETGAACDILRSHCIGIVKMSFQGSPKK
jgi:hypothetical protein